MTKMTKQTIELATVAAGVRAKFAAAEAALSEFESALARGEVDHESLGAVQKQFFIAGLGVSELIATGIPSVDFPFSQARPVLLTK